MSKLWAGVAHGQQRGSDTQKVSSSQETRGAWRHTVCTLQVQEQVAEVEAAGQTLRSVQHIRKATTRRPDAVCSVPVASRAAEKLLNNAETCCYPPSDSHRQRKATDDRVRRIVSSSRGSCNEHGSQEFFPHVIEHTSRMCPTGV